MAKMRVHELAKELNIKSQDILDKLKNTKFDGKSASSNMEDEAQALIRGAFAKETKSAADAKKPEAAKTGAGKPADGKDASFCARRSSPDSMILRKTPGPQLHL